jgi:hypothetical protein
LNSAAFWFLPGGLIMLCQLVCTDRRYARMNCFNIRELQGILKRRFFVDLVNSHDYKDILNTTMLGLKYKMNNQINLNLDSVLFYNWGILRSRDSKVSLFINSNFDNNVNFISLHDVQIYTFLRFNLDLSLILSYISFYLVNFFSLFFSLFSLPSVLIYNLFFKNVLNFVSFNLVCLRSNMPTQVTFLPSLDQNHSVLFFSKTLSLNESINNFSFLEHSKQQRLTRFSNSLIGYDYKTGHYLGSSEAYYPHLILSFLEVARGIRKPSWAFSDQYLELLNQNYNSYFVNFTGKINLKLAGVEE